MHCTIVVNGWLYFMQAKISRPTHYEAMGLVDPSHPGQGGDFDDEAPVTLLGKTGKDKSKGGKHTLHLCPLINLCTYDCDIMYASKMYRAFCGNKGRVLCSDMWAMPGAALRPNENETTWYMQKQRTH